MLHWIVTELVRYGYVVIVAGVLLENAGIPAPGHTVVLGGAFLAQQGRLSIVWVAVCACAAAVVGDNIGFWIGHRYGQELLERHPRLFPKHRRRKLHRFFDQHGAKAVFIGRFVTGLQTIAAVMAGTSHMRWRSFFLWNVLGAIAWTTAYCALGYLAGSSVGVLDHWLGRIGLAILGLVVVGAGVYLAWRRHRRAAHAA